MTTIAWRDRMLAADSMAVTHGWSNPGAFKKLFRLKDGRCAGVSGTYAEALRLLKWIEAGQQGEQPEGDCTVVVMRQSGVVEIFVDGASFCDEARFGAIGSGMPPALGAMHAGADALEAVRIASLVDPSTGGSFSFLRPVAPDKVVAETPSQLRED